MLVRETIHHGEYYNVREQEIEPTWQGFMDLLRQSPYHQGLTPEHDARNKYVARLFADLLTSRTGHLGWARYKVIR